MNGTALGFIESSSIARAVQAIDAMLKRAAVELLMSVAVPRGKYLVMVRGTVADVEQAMAAGLETVGSAAVDHFVIPNAHPQLAAAIKGRVKVADVEALGLIETKEVAPAIYAGDAAVKAAAVTLVEARNQPGAKGLVVVAGEVGAVRAAVTAGVATVKDGMLIAEVVIPYAHRTLVESLS